MTDKRKKLSPEQWEIAMKYRKQFDEKNDRLMLLTAQTVLPLIGYIVTKIEDMDEKLDYNNWFSMKLKNKSNHAIKACEEFIGTFEEFIDEKKMGGYGLMTDILYPCLDSWFDTLVKQKDVNPPSEVVRRAKLRYHDPYKAMVRERQESFEDGYEKGYCDCVRDVQRELIKLQDIGDAQAVINITNGMVEIAPVEDEVNASQRKGE